MSGTVRYQKYETLPHKTVQRCIVLPAFAFAGLALQCRVSLCLAILSILLGFAEKSAQNCSGIGVFSFFHMFYLCGTGIQSPSSSCQHLLANNGSALV